MIYKNVKTKDFICWYDRVKKSHKQALMIGTAFYIIVMIFLLGYLFVNYPTIMNGTNFLLVASILFASYFMVIVLGFLKMKLLEVVKWK